MPRAETSYQNEIIAAVLSMCRRDKFAMVTDFAWYVGVLAEAAVVLGSRHGEEVAAQLAELALRVEDARPFAVETSLSLLFDERLVLSQARHSVAEVCILFKYNSCYQRSLPQKNCHNFHRFRHCERRLGSSASTRPC